MSASPPSRVQLGSSDVKIILPQSRSWLRKCKRWQYNGDCECKHYASDLSEIKRGQFTRKHLARGVSVERKNLSSSESQQTSTEFTRLPSRIIDIIPLLRYQG